MPYIDVSIWDTDEVLFSYVVPDPATIRENASSRSLGVFNSAGGSDELSSSCRTVRWPMPS
jgi:hypothetical protein